jgi:hypothetical protein
MVGTILLLLGLAGLVLVILGAVPATRHYVPYGVQLGVTLIYVALAVLAIGTAFPS